MPADGTSAPPPASSPPPDPTGTTAGEPPSIGDGLESPAQQQMRDQIMAMLNNVAEPEPPSPTERLLDLVSYPFRPHPRERVPLEAPAQQQMRDQITAMLNNAAEPEPPSRISRLLDLVSYPFRPHPRERVPLESPAQKQMYADMMAALDAAAEPDGQVSGALESVIGRERVRTRAERKDRGPRLLALGGFAALGLIVVGAALLGVGGWGPGRDGGAPAGPVAQGGVAAGQPSAPGSAGGAATTGVDTDAAASEQPPTAGQPATGDASTGVDAGIAANDEPPSAGGTPVPSAEAEVGAAVVPGTLVGAFDLKSILASEKWPGAWTVTADENRVTLVVEPPVSAPSGVTGHFRIRLPISTTNEPGCVLTLEIEGTMTGNYAISKAEHVAQGTATGTGTPTMSGSCSATNRLSGVPQPLEGMTWKVAGDGTTMMGTFTYLAPDSGRRLVWTLELHRG